MRYLRLESFSDTIPCVSHNLVNGFWATTLSPSLNSCPASLGPFSLTFSAFSSLAFMWLASFSSEILLYCCKDAGARVRWRLPNIHWAGLSPSQTLGVLRYSNKASPSCLLLPVFFSSFFIAPTACSACPLASGWYGLVSWWTIPSSRH